MKPLDANLQCPSCKGELRPALLVCDACDIRVEGPFRLNEFTSLGPDDLHFLRIFVQSEGRIRDMEAALGLSYPTIRTRLTALKRKLAGPLGTQSPRVAAADSAAQGLAAADTLAHGPSDTPESVTAIQSVLTELETGAIPFEEALKRIRKLSPKP